MDFFTRYKNSVVLATLLLVQLLALAVQVKRQTPVGPVRLIRVVSVNALSPFERLLIYSGKGTRNLWSNYLDLRDVRRENDRLKADVERMRMEQARYLEDARQARRIQALLAFKEQWIDQTVAAQVIGTSGTETSRLIYIDKGSKAGIKPDMPVITPDGVVGKVLNVYGETAQVLLISDPSSGVGAILVNSRLQGIVKGTATGEVQLNYIMGDEAVQPGEALVTSGGDRVFPKGVPLGTVSKVAMGRNLFLDIKLKPAADLNRLEEVLVITEQKARAPENNGQTPVRASDILSEHLPGVPQQPQTPAGATVQPQQQSAAQPQPAKATTAQPSTQPAQPPAKPAQSAPVKPAPQATAPLTSPKPAAPAQPKPAAAVATKSAAVSATGASASGRSGLPAHPPAPATGAGTKTGSEGTHAQ